MDNKKEKIPARVGIIRFSYALFAAVFFICIVIQVFLAGVAIFANPGNWTMHSTFVDYFAMLPAAMFLLSFLGRIGGGLRWIALGLYALNAFQYMSIHLFSAIGMLAALHPANALLLFWGSLHLMKRSWPWLLLRSEASASSEELKSI